MEGWRPERYGAMWGIGVNRWEFIHSVGGVGWAGGGEGSESLSGTHGVWGMRVGESSGGVTWVKRALLLRPATLTIIVPSQVRSEY